MVSVYHPPPPAREVQQTACWKCPRPHPGHMRPPPKSSARTRTRACERRGLHLWTRIAGPLESKPRVKDRKWSARTEPRSERTGPTSCRSRRSRKGTIPAAIAAAPRPTITGAGWSALPEPAESRNEGRRRRKQPRRYPGQAAIILGNEGRRETDTKGS